MWRAFRIQSCLHQKHKSLPNGVDIESASASNTERVLHAGLVSGRRSSAVEPVGVGSSGDVFEDKGTTSCRVILVKDINL